MFPKLIQIGSFPLPMYGVMVAAGFLAALWIVRRLAARAKLNDEHVTNLVIYCAFAGLAGAKLFMFLFDWELYASRPSEIFSLTTLQAAGVYQGGFLLALCFALWYTRRNQMPVLTTMDVFAPGIALGHGFGRIGCFCAGCCYGTECRRPWAVEFNDVEAYKLSGTPLGIPLHPTQLYEAAFNFALFAFLYQFFQRSPRPGQVFGAYLTLYSVFRFCVEFVRHHEQALSWGLSNTQWISIGTLPIGLWLYVRPLLTAGPGGSSPARAR